MMFIPIPGARMRVAASIHGAAANAFKPKGVDTSKLDEDGHLEDPSPPTTAEIATVLDQRGPGSRPDIELLWSSRYRIQHRVAGSFRAGNVFLVGDAAHTIHPLAGQGLNMGLGDVESLFHCIHKSVLNGGDIGEHCVPSGCACRDVWN